MIIKRTRAFIHCYNVRSLHGPDGPDGPECHAGLQPVNQAKTFRVSKFPPCLKFAGWVLGLWVVE